MSDRIKVLLIEANPGDAVLIRRMLTNAPDSQFGLKTAKNLSTGIDMVSRGQTDVLLLDLSLPDFQGLESLTKVQSLEPDFPIIVLTGLDDEEVAIRSVNQGAADFLVKNQINTALLSRSIRYAIERQRNLNQLADQASQLEANHANLQAILERTSDGVMLVNRDGVV